jgi:hypothetical protein
MINNDTYGNLSERQVKKVVKQVQAAGAAGKGGRA